jgi:diguanylate cyclase (GGDEF)-like protein
MYHDVVMDKTKDGSEFYVEFNIAPILGRDKKIEHFIFTGTDVSKRIKIEHKLKQLATIDSLTKVYNRYKINEIIEQQIARSKRYGETFSVVMFDIDYFKKVNDTYGHYVGDLVLKKLSELISQNIREVDSFGRWGGEEFMLLLHKANKAEAVYIAEKLRKMIENFSIENRYKITISIGVTSFVKNDTKTSLLERVDQALYASKKGGRNRVTFQ